ncbi:hypothetical protein [Peribacillus simplex]
MTMSKQQLRLQTTHRIDRRGNIEGTYSLSYSGWTCVLMEAEWISST